MSGIRCFAALSLLGLCALASGDDAYVSEGFVPLPADVQIGAMSAVAVDGPDRLYVLHRGEPPLLVLSALRAFGCIDAILRLASKIAVRSPHALPQAAVLGSLGVAAVSGTTSTAA